MTQGPGTYLNLAAGGDILPMSFVKLSAAADETCLQCAAGDVPVGISGTWTQYGGGTPANDTQAQGGLEASSGEFPQVASLGCVVPLICGNTGTWVRGNLLKPDALGYGTPISANTDVVGAIALESATPGVHARVMVLVPTVRPTITLRSDEEAMDALKKEFEEDEKARLEKEEKDIAAKKVALRPTELHAEKADLDQREKEAKDREEAAKEEQKKIQEQREAHQG